MSETLVQSHSKAFRIGLGILLFFTAGNVLGHIGLLLFEPAGDTIFMTWAIFNLMALTILLIPYRRIERWSWYAIWAVVLPYALIILFNAEVGPIYLGEAVLMAIAQILTYAEFFSQRSQA